MEIPDLIWNIVTRSRGRIFCRKQAFRAGFSDGTLYRWLRAGLVHRLAPGWYRIVDDVVPVDQMLWLAAQYLRYSSGPPPIFTGSTALARLGVPGFRMDGPPTILIDHGDRVRIRGMPFFVLHADVAEVAHRSVQGLAVATPARALADLHREWPSTTTDDLVAAVDRARNHLRLGVPELMDEWGSIVRHPGAAKLLALARAGEFDVDSGGERTALREIFSHCAAPPDCQVVVLGGLTADFAYLFANLIIEYYGGVHDGTADADATRTMALSLARYLVIVLTKGMMDDPIGTAEYIDETRRRREQQVLEGTLERAAIPVQPRRRAPLRTLVPIG